MNQLDNKIKISNDVFSNLKRITNFNEEDRVNGAVMLLRHLFNQEKDADEYWYTLKRLVRGCGSSTTECRTSFFSCLVGFLNFSSNECPSCDQILDIASKELSSKPAISNKEDSDAATGMILVCGALIRSAKRTMLTCEDMTRLTQILMVYSKCKSYHQIFAYIFLIELMKVVSEDQFIKYCYSVIKDEIQERSQTYNTGIMYLVIEIFKFYPNLKTNFELKTSYNLLIKPSNFNDIAVSLLNNKNSNLSLLPLFQNVCNSLATCDFLQNFWEQSVEPLLVNSTKNIEVNLLKFAAIIFNNSAEKLSYILSNNFVKLLVNGLKSKKDKVVELIYQDFFEALITYCNKSETDNKEKLKIIKKLILYPGVLNIEKYTNERVIHQLVSKCDEDSFIDLYDTYKQIFLNSTIKDPKEKTIQWSNAEKIYAGNMMQYLLNHKVMQSSYKWKKQEMNSIMVMGFFYTNDSLEIIEHSKDNSIISNELADQMKKIFFCSLQNKFSLENENKILYYLVQTCNVVLNKKNFDKFFRFNVKENFINIWNEMFKGIRKIKLCKSLKKDSNKLDYVFNILLMHMGLQLFKDSDMAGAAIVDLKICLDKSKEKVQQRDNRNESSLSNFEEPEWIEVVVDLFLHLLSQNSSSLRNIVKSVFPHLCESITLSSMNQIFEMLMKDGLNAEIDQNNLEKQNGDISYNIKLSDNDTDSESNKEDSSESEDSILGETTEADKFRSQISQALIKNNIDNYADSIDLDEMSEEEGRKLDEILADVFKMKSNSLKGIKGSKVNRIESTALMHFRIRVLDLIDIYIQNKPTLLITLEIMISLLNTFKYCANDESIIFIKKVENILHKITNLKNFSMVEEVDNLFDYVIGILHIKFKSLEKEQFSIHCKCILFVININNILKQENFDKKVITELQNCVKDFLKSKNAKVNTDFLKYLFKSNWISISKLGVTLINIAIDPAVKSYKRIQVLDFLELLYKNNQLIRLDDEATHKYFRIIETKLEAYFEYFVNQELSSKEFNKFIDFLLVIANFHKRKQTEVAFNKNNLCKNMQILRDKINLEHEKEKNYVRFCSNYNLEPVTNNVVKINKKRKLLKKQEGIIKKKKQKIDHI